MEIYKNIPSIYDIVESNELQHISHIYKREIIKKILNEIIYNIKRDIKNYKNYSKNDFLQYISNDLKFKIDNIENSFNKIINATGIISHTNIGRSPISKAILEKSTSIAYSYVNIEYDYETNSRLDRNKHISYLINLLTNAQDSIVVNNNAAALMLIANTFAKNKDILIARGEAIEIGDGFRILDILKTSGANIKEVGSTNRTYINDYEENIDVNTAFILKVDKSNYEINGFTNEVSVKELTRLNNIIVVEDLGSGNIIDLQKYLSIHERTVQDSITDDVDIVCFSTDKILSSCQSGIISGKKEYIQKLRQNPMFRALRVGKNTTITLYETLKNYMYNDNTNIAMMSILSQNEDDLYIRAKKIHYDIKNISTIEKSISYLGGGISKNLSKSSYCVSIKCNDIDSLHKKLAKENILGYIKNDSLKLDVMCIEDNDIPYIIHTLKILLGEYV